MRKLLGIGVGVLIAVVGVLSMVYTTAAQTDAVVSILALHGQPQIMKAGSTAWQRCALRQTVDTGDRIQTAAGESVDIAFTKDKANVVHIGERSDVFIKTSQSPYAIELMNGRVMALVGSLPKGSTFEVRTPAGVSGARGTGWESIAAGNQSTFNAFQNSIYVRGIDASGNDVAGELIVGEGYGATVERLQRPGGLNPLSDEDRQRWNNWLATLGGGLGQFGGPEALEQLTDKTESRTEDRDEVFDVDRIAERTAERTIEREPSSNDDGGPY